jgi:hypothetical protein
MKTWHWILLTVGLLVLLIFLTRKPSAAATAPKQPSFWDQVMGLGTSVANLGTALVSTSKPKGGNRVDPGMADTGGSSSAGLINDNPEGHSITYGPDPSDATQNGPFFGLF